MITTLLVSFLFSGPAMPLVGVAGEFVPGPLLATGNPLDIAINGEGYFQIERPGGQIVYTRDGKFKRNAKGILVTSDGCPLLPKVRIPVGATAIDVSTNGVVSAALPKAANPTKVAQIQIVMFRNPAGLIRVGKDLYLQGDPNDDPVVVTPCANDSGELQARFLEVRPDSRRHTRTSI